MRKECFCTSRSNVLSPFANIALPRAFKVISTRSSNCVALLIFAIIIICKRRELGGKKQPRIMNGYNFTGEFGRCASFHLICIQQVPQKKSEEPECWTGEKTVDKNWIIFRSCLQHVKNKQIVCTVFFFCCCWKCCLCFFFASLHASFHGTRSISMKWMDEKTLTHTHLESTNTKAAKASNRNGFEPQDEFTSEPEA